MVVGGVVVLGGYYLCCFDYGVVDVVECGKGVVIGGGFTFESVEFLQEDCWEFRCFGAPVLYSVAVSVVFGFGECKGERDVVGRVIVVVVVVPDFGNMGGDREC